MKKIIAICLCLCILAGCAPKNVTENTSVSSEVKTETRSTTEATTTAAPMPLNPLTGLETESDEAVLLRKPVAIMIGNSPDALPQFGVSKADILVEMMAEGGITRLMGIWQDPSGMERIGSVRSARPYFIDMAQWLDAYFLHFGGSVPAYNAIAERDDLKALDGIRGGYEGSLFVRDSERRKQFKLEHTVVTSGERIEETLAKFENTERKNPDQTAFGFDENHSAKNGSAAEKLTIDYFTINKPYFVYDENSGNYLRYQYKQAHHDGEYDENIAVKNVIILEMPFEPVPGDPLKIVEVQTTGSGAGKYFADGKFVDIKWSKDAYNEPLVLKDSEGKELKVCPGQTYLGVIKTGGKLTIEEKAQ